MANDCLVTKLKGEVQNDNLPFFGKLFLSKVSTPSDSTALMWCIATGDKAVTLKSKVAYHFGGVQGEFTETLIPANTCWAGVYNSEDVAESIDELIELSDVYSCKCVGLYRSNSSYICPIKFKPNSGVPSLKYAGIEAITIDEEDMFDLPDSLRYIHIQCPIGTGNTKRDIESLLRLPNIDYINLSVDDNTFDSRIDLSKNYNSSPVVVLNARPVGPINNLPINIEFTNIAGSTITGTIEDWVANMRLAGRTTGKCILVGISSCSGVTYTIDGQTKTLRQWVSDGVITAQDTAAVLNWDADTITFNNSASGVRKVDSIYSWYMRNHPIENA